MQFEFDSLWTTTVKIDNPIKEGWLVKKSRYLSQWRDRWVVLNKSKYEYKLFSFKNEQIYENPTEILNLNVFTSIKSSEETTNKRYSFDIYSPTTTFTFVAKNEIEKEDWIRFIGKSIIRTGDIEQLLQQIWSIERTIWIAFYKNNDNQQCLIQNLPKDIVCYIISFVRNIDSAVDKIVAGIRT